MQPEQQLNTPDGAMKVFSIYFEEMERKDFDLKGKTILNIGAGDLIGLDALFLLYGAGLVISLDLRPGNYLYPEITGQWHFFEELADRIRSTGPKPISEPWIGIIEKKKRKAFYNTNRLQRIAPCDAACIPLRDHSVDFAFSNAVLEHVGNPEGVVREIARVLSPDGHTMHRVDLRDHQDFSKPLEFLKPGVPANGCNLWRASQFEQAFGMRPLRIKDFVIFDSRKVGNVERASFRHPFCNQSLEELGKLRFSVYATIQKS